MKLLIHSKVWEWIGIFVSLFIASMLTYMMGRKLYKPCYPLRPRQNECYFADDKVNCIFLNENVWISIKISLKFVPKGPINNIQVLVQIVAWRRPGAKPLSEPMVASLLTHICVTRPQWVNKTGPAIVWERGVIFKNIYKPSKFNGLNFQRWTKFHLANAWVIHFGYSSKFHTKYFDHALKGDSYT